MGGAKRMWEEYLERGWSAPEKMVCPDCVEDEYLKQLITEAAECDTCDYCGQIAEHEIAAPVEEIMPAISSALTYFYAEPASAGVPYDGGWIVEPVYTADALMEIPFDAHLDLFEDVQGAFENLAWVAAAEGHWASSHRNEEWSYAWSSFTEMVKHQSRYFFMSVGESEESHLRTERPLRVLESIAWLCTSVGLIASFPKGTQFFRVREREFSSNWEICSEQLGAPPSVAAGAGRMNPAGISYLYLATELRSALAEVLRSPPCVAAWGCFEATKDLVLLDLTKIPDAPSVFDEGQRRKREAILFLQDFVADISQPVKKDGKEHISYVPSQVVSEYFAQVFTTGNGEQLDGIAYPSAVQVGGTNVVLFPRYQYKNDERVVFVTGEEVSFETWADLVKAIS